MRFQPFRVGKYEFVELLGRGGMAEVYRVRLRGTGSFAKQFAVKRILPGNWSNPKMVERFEHEASLNGMLTHPNIVQVFDFFRASDTYFLVMEYIEGWNLRQLCAKAMAESAQLPFELGVYLVSEMLKGLDYAHRKHHPETGDPLHIIHRDISPANVMVSRDGAVKLCDFGVAKARSMVNQTETDVLLGKAPYMSPEQANGDPLDQRTDIFSTCSVLWELLLGAKLFQGGSDMATLKLARECQIPRPSSVNLKLPLQLERILQRGLAKEPKDRFQTAAEFQEQLQDFQSSFCPSYTQRKVAEFLIQFFEGTVVMRRPEDEEMLPFQPREEEAMVQGLKRLGEILDDSGELPKFTPDLKVERPRPTPPKRRPKLVETAPPIPAFRPDFREEPPFPRARRYAMPAAVALFTLLIGIGVGALLRLPVRDVSGFLQSMTDGKFPGVQVPTGSCSMTISSRPTGAQVTMDHVLRGTTPLTLQTVCGTTPELSLELPGHYRTERKISVNRNSDQFFFELSPAPPGSLEVVVNRAARIYSDEKLVGRVGPREVFRTPLEVGRHYSFIFTDEQSGKSIVRRYAVGKQNVVRDQVEFDD